MPEFANEQKTRTDRHRPGRPLRTALVLLLAVALIVDVVVVDTAQVGFLVPVFVAVGIARYYGNQGQACGRRHAK
jgi:hypothetical protein